jgi:UDP-N-acetylmuramate dehydrogenase
LKYREIQDVVRGRIFEDEPLSRHTSFRIGGPADWYVFPADVEDLTALLRVCREREIPTFAIGNGTNLLVSDQGFRGVVVDLKKACGTLRADGEQVIAGSAVRIKRLTAWCEERGLGGLECLSGIPGTVGGALRMNAGAFGGEISDRLRWIEGIAPDGTRQRWAKSDVDFGYRRAGGLEDRIVVEAAFGLTRTDAALLTARRKEILRKRNARQPLEVSSAGSVFKRPEGDYAGRLIEAAGCKGLRVGDAMVSSKHANFIVNLGKATASEVHTVIERVREQVEQKFGVVLELEIELVGF